MRVDFYLLKDTSISARFSFACRLIEKAYARSHRIYVHTANAEDAHKMDDLLWVAQDDSFIPHTLFGEGPTPPPPVQIGYDTDPIGCNDILINLTLSVPAFYQRFARLIEVIPNEESVKQKSRENYRIYREKGCHINTHHI